MFQCEYFCETCWKFQIVSFCCCMHWPNVTKIYWDGVHQFFFLMENVDISPFYVQNKCPQVLSGSKLKPVVQVQAGILEEDSPFIQKLLHKSYYVEKPLVFDARLAHIVCARGFKMFRKKTERPEMVPSHQLSFAKEPRNNSCNLSKSLR